MTEIYEFVNPSDCITFYAENDEYARAVALLLGNGKGGCKKKDGTLLDYCFTAFGNPAPQEVYDGIKKCASEWCEELGMNSSTFFQRLKNGLNPFTGERV